MGKRGRQLYEERTSSMIPPERVIAQRLGICERSVHTHLKSAITKLKAIPGAMEVLELNLAHKRYMERNVIQCASVECRPDWIALNER